MSDGGFVGEFFERGSFAEELSVEHHNVESMDYETLPEARIREQAISLTLSFASEEERELLVERLGRRVVRGGRRWTCDWTEDRLPTLFDVGEGT